MQMTWKVARLFDTDVRVHVNFPLIIIWFVVLAKSMGHTGESLALLLGLFAAACASILLHEFGHVLVARRHGIPTKDVTMLPIGAMSRLERNPEDPTADLAISAAGPLVSIALAFAFLLGAKATGQPFLRYLFWTNMIVAGLNLIPALPLDGGKMIKALLSLVLEKATATRIAAGTSYAAGIVLFVYGIRADPFFVIVSGMVVYCARRETQRLRAEELAKAPLVRTAVVTHFEYLSPDSPLAEVFDLVLASPQRDLPVVDGNKLCGIVTRAAAKRGLRGGAAQVLVRDVMAKDFAVVHVEEKLEEALAWMLAEDLWVLPVTNGEVLVGMLRLADAEDAQLMHSAQLDALDAAS